VPDLLNSKAAMMSWNAAGDVARCESAIFMCARAGQSKLTKMLLELGASFEDDRPNFEALLGLLFDMCSTNCSDDDAIDQVLQVTSIIDDTRDRPMIPLEMHPLYAAIETGSVEIAMALLRNNGVIVRGAMGHEVVIADVMGSDTIVGYAMHMIHHEDQDGEDTRQSLTRRSSTTSLTNMTFHSGGTWRTQDGWTLLSRAIYLGLITVVEMLIEARAPPIYSPKQELENSEAIVASASWVDSADWNDEGGGMEMTENPTRSLRKFNSSFVSGSFSDVDTTERPLWIPSTPRVIDTKSDDRGKVAVPNAYSVALIREYQQTELVKYLEDTDDGTKEFDMKLRNARDKLELSKGMVECLNKHKDVARLRRVWISTFAMGKALFHIAFIILFVVAALESSKSTPAKYTFNDLASAKTIATALPLDQEVHNIAVFGDVGSEDELWTFLDSTLMDNLYPDGFNDGWLDDHNRLLGAVHLFQDRDTATCKDSIANVWSDLAPGSSEAATKSCYRLTQDNSIDYDILLPYNKTAAIQAIAALETVEWIDGATSSVTIEYVVGNIRDEFIQLARLEFEFHSTGGSTASSTFVVLPSSSVGSWSAGDAMAVVVGIIFLVYSFEEWYECVQLGVYKYLSDGWNIGDLTTCALGLSWCSILLHSRINGIDILDKFAKKVDGDPDSHVLDLWPVGDGYLSAEAVVGFALMAVCFKLIKYLRFLPMLGPNMLSLLHTLLSIRVFTFSIFVAFFVTSVGVGAYVRFGASAEEFSDISISIFSVFTAVLGESFQDAMLGGDTNFSSGMAFFIFLSFVGTAILGNAFISVTGSVYNEAYHSSEKDWENAVDALMMKNNWVKARGELGISNFARYATLLGRGIFKKSCRVAEWNSINSAREDFKKLQELEKEKMKVENMTFNVNSDEQLNKRKSLLSMFKKKKRKSISGVDMKNSYFELQEFRRKKLFDIERIINEIRIVKKRLRKLQFIELSQNTFGKALWNREGERPIGKALLLHDLSDESIEKWKEQQNKSRKDKDGENDKAP
jgi:hypothetical protein